MKMWAYLAASIGLIIGLLLILRPKDKKWKHGLWFVSISLAVFFGGNLNIGNLFPISDSFNYTKQLQALSNDVTRLTAILHVQQSQSQSLSVIVTNINNNVTQVSTQVVKEVADVKELIADLYSRTHVEQIEPTDTNKLMFLKDMAFENEYGLCFLLKESPTPNSVNVYLLGKEGVTALPPVCFQIYKNMVFFAKVGTPSMYRDTSFVFSYVSDPHRATNDVIRTPLPTDEPPISSGKTPKLIVALTNSVYLKGLGGDAVGR